MMCNCCCGRMSCIIPIIIGIITGVLSAVYLTVTAIPVFAWLVFGLSILALIILTSSALAFEPRRENDVSECLCKNGVCLLVGLFGTLVTSIITLILGTLGRTLLFLVTGFLGWMLAALFIFMICIIYKKCE